jgi:hypothetical protein
LRTVLLRAGDEERKHFHGAFPSYVDGGSGRNRGGRRAGMRCSVALTKAVSHSECGLLVGLKGELLG